MQQNQYDVTFYSSNRFQLSRDNMFRMSVPGLNKIIDSDIPRGYIIVLSGGLGTLKSTFAFTAMNGILKNNKKKIGAYVTIEQNSRMLIQNMKSSGIVPHKSIFFSDIASVYSNLKDLKIKIYYPETPEFALKALNLGKYRCMFSDKPPVGGVKDMVCYTLDSLNALISISEIKQEKRRDFINEFFYTLKKNNVIAFIIWELDQNNEQANNEVFSLADGVLEFGINRDCDPPSRYFAVRKMKCVNYKLQEFGIGIGKNGVILLS